MPSCYAYEKTLYNKFLGETKVIKAYTLSDLEIKEKGVYSRWAKLEKAKQTKTKIENLKLQAKYKDSECKKELEQYNNLLINALGRDTKVDWNSLLKKSKFKDFSFNMPKPRLEETYSIMNVPKKNILELIIPYVKNRRLNKEKEAQKQYEKALKIYNEQRDNAYKDYINSKNKFENSQEKFNQSILQFKSDFENNVPEAIEKYVYRVLSHSTYPKSFSKEIDIQYIKDKNTLVISKFVPTTKEIPKVTEYKYIINTKSIKAVEMNKKIFHDFYENIIFNTSLKTIYEVFTSIYTSSLEYIVFNGWVRGIDPATGNDFTSCILSVKVSKDEFEAINLERVNPKACIRQLKGLMAGPLYELAPVKPILDINRHDKRFIESRDILAKLNSKTNLATMNWEDFEHLIRQLFEKMYTEKGCEVKVTRASRDSGVDAVVFDPDPIRGGKFIIQAKRYNIVVPPSAVRDLFGTVHNENASKGILVTTSYYGDEAKEFAADKPILTLIDGANLIHLFKEYGYNVRIDLKNKKTM